MVKFSPKAKLKILGKSMNILIVDDSHTIRRELKLLLEKHHYLVFEAGNGVEGLTFLKNCEFEIDLIISDLEMPQMDGVEFIKNKKEIPKYKDTPCLIYTSNIKPGLRDITKPLGVKAVLPKPLKENHVMRIISSILKK